MIFAIGKRAPFVVPAVVVFICMVLVLSVGVLSNDFWHIRLRGHFYRLFQTPNSASSSSSSSSSSSFIHSHCVIYDKSPRTGSSTILNMLRKCWMQLKYKYRRRLPHLLQKYPNITYIQHALNISEHRVMIAGEHFRMNQDDVISLATNCERLFYITSTRPMQERILSKAKFECSGGRTYKNTTVSKKGRVKIISKISDIEYTSAAEKRLEEYPFSTSFTIPPDYVIRSSYLVDDLRLLLDAFSCQDVEVWSKNVHVYNKFWSQQRRVSSIDDSDEDTPQDDDEIDNEDISPIEHEDLMKIDLLYNDMRHKEMLRWADRFNERGLEKAANFI